MVKRKLSQFEEAILLFKAEKLIRGKSRVSTKTLRKAFGISGPRASWILNSLGWIRHRRNGKSGTVYFPPRVTMCTNSLE